MAVVAAWLLLLCPRGGSAAPGVTEALAEFEVSVRSSGLPEGRGHSRSWGAGRLVVPPNAGSSRRGTGTVGKVTAVLQSQTCPVWAEPELCPQVSFLMSLLTARMNTKTDQIRTPGGTVRHERRFSWREGLEGSAIKAHFP